MKINYEYTKKDLEKYLLKSRLLNNIVLFIIGVIIYILFISKKVYLPLYIVGLIVLIYLLNIFYIKAYFKVNEMLNNQLYGNYTLELTPNRLSVTVNKVKADYKYKSIKKIVEKKDKLILKLNKSRESLIFEKKSFSSQDYIKVIEKLKEKVNS